MDNTLEQLKGLLKRKRSEEYYAQELNITVEEVRELKKIIRSENEESQANEEPEISFGTEYKENLAKGTFEVNTYYDHPPTSSEVIRDHKVNEKEWELTQFYSKGKSKGWLVTALFGRIKKNQKFALDLGEYLKSYKTDYKPVKLSDKVINDKFDNKVSVVISLCDFHLDKLDREMIPVEQRLELYNQTVDTLIRRAYLAHNIEEIVFVIGNDLFQTDTIQGTTVKGTPVASSQRWDKAYEMGFDLMRNTISKLSTYAPKVKVVLALGNHSASKEYFLSHALDLYFESDPSITFDRTSDKYKAHVYGETAMFFNHGDNINDRLPLLFAQTFREIWGSTKYSEILLGHYHMNNEKKFVRSQAETQGTRMRILSALTGTDEWHYDNLFTNSIQAGIALVYDKVKGKCSEFEHRI